MDRPALISLIRSVRRAGGWLLVILIACAEPVSARAEGVVTNTSLPALYKALLGGGRVTFSLPVTNATFTLTAPLLIQTDTALDASTNNVQVVLAGSGGARLLTVSTGVTLRLVNLTLRQGSSTNGGAIFNDGGTVIASNCVFRGNLATGTNGVNGEAGANTAGIGENGQSGGAGVPATGGAIWSRGRLELYGCLFETNRATGGNGGNGGTGGRGDFKGGRGGDGGAGGIALGGAIWCEGDLVLSRCTLRANQALAGSGGTGGAEGAGAPGTRSVPGRGHPGTDAAGGAIYSLGTLALDSCTFVTNTATAGRGADEAHDAAGFGRDGRPGGAAFGGGVTALGSLAMLNCTLTDNAVAGGQGGRGGAGLGLPAGSGGAGGAALGGGLWTEGPAGVTNCTFATGNVSGGPGGGAGVTNGLAGVAGASLGGNLAMGDGALTLVNTLLANARGGGNGYGAVTDGGHNLSSDTSLDLNAAGSRTGVDPLIGSLGANGGGLDTIPLLVGSPAVDAGVTLTNVTRDQRGVVRPQQAAYDIGAFERGFSGLAGRITWTNLTQTTPAPLPGVTVKLISAVSPVTTTVTDAAGRFEFIRLPGTDQGVYRVEPEPTIAGFNPPFRLVTLSTSTTNVTDLDFRTRLPDLAPDSIVSSGLVGGIFQFSFHGTPGAQYRVQTAVRLGDWNDAAPATTDAEGIFVFREGAPAATPAVPPVRFYRVVKP